jgi:hypothetical protein
MIILTQQRLWGNVKTCMYIQINGNLFCIFSTCLSVCSMRRKIWQWKKLQRKFLMLQLVVTITHLIVNPGKCCYCLIANIYNNLRWAQPAAVHCKKSFLILPSPAGMSITKLFLGGNNDVINKLFPPRKSLVSDIPAGDGNIEKLFYSVW